MEEEGKPLTLDDFERICRVCLADSSYINLKPLIPATIQILRGITQVKIENSQDDKLPRNICTNCSSFLNDVLIFADTYKSNEGILKKILEDRETSRETDRQAILKQLESGGESEDENFAGWGFESREEDDIPQAVQEESEDDKPLHLIKQEQQKENSTKLANKTQEPKKEVIIKRKKIKSDIPLKSVRRKRGKKRKFKLEKEQSDSKIPVCSACGTTFTSKTKLCSHYKENEVCRPKWFEVFQCKVCEKEFSTERRRDEHMNIHTGETPYMCTYCGKSFQLYTAHYKHVYKHRLALGEVELKPGYTERRVKLNLQCDQCPKIFASRSGFANHLLMHKGIKVVYKRRPKKEGQGSKEKKFLCNHCGKGFRTKMQLDGHIRAHTGERPFHCSFCGKEFRTKGSLRIHEMNHLGTMPKRFVCEVCNKPFALKAHFEVHQRTHTGEKPYACHFCGKCFNYQGTLKIHLRLHTGETPYICPVCNSRYHDRSALNKHQKKQGHEGEVIVEEKEIKITS